MMKSKDCRLNLLYFMNVEFFDQLLLSFLRIRLVFWYTLRCSLDMGQNRPIIEDIRAQSILSGINALERNRTVNHENGSVVGAFLNLWMQAKIVIEKVIKGTAEETPLDSGSISSSSNDFSVFQNPYIALFYTRPIWTGIVAMFEYIYQKCSFRTHKTCG